MDKQTNTPEEHLAHRVAQALDVNLATIDDANLQRLHAARTAAMSAYREPIRIAGLVTVSGQILDARTWIRKPAFLVPFAAVAILAAVGAYNSLSQEDLADESGAQDAKVLAGETPIDALLDKDFATGVQESSQQ